MRVFQALSVLLTAGSVFALMGTAANTTDTVYAGFTARTLCEGVSHLFPVTKVSMYVMPLAPHQHWLTAMRHKHLLPAWS